MKAPFKYLLSICFASILLLLYNCNNEKPIHEGPYSIRNFSPITNWQPDSVSQKTIFLDYSDAMSGFVIPSTSQTKSGYFKFSFEIKNNTTNNQKFYYKIYYQNESYKFPELDSAQNTEHLFAEENFYGSWENTAVGFRPIAAVSSDNYTMITDSFRIVGNPREEKRYFTDTINDRWKRNPRVGEYSFLLVVVPEQQLKTIPDYIQNISVKNKNHFTNPYYYFLSGKGESTALVTKANTSLKIISKPNLGTGIYINKYHFGGRPYDTAAYCNTCNESQNLDKSAPVEQFIHYVDASTKFYNVPIVADILKDNYSRIDYNWNKAFYAHEELIPTFIQTTNMPCQTVFSDPKEKKIVIKNPRTKPGEWKKESVGIITRHGFTYGKFRVKVKLTELLNKNNLWNGITNAIWLITQGGGEWNYRRACNNKGYMATYWGGPNDKRVPTVDYSEIDFEILKAPPYCPTYNFPPVYKGASINNKNINAWNVPFPDEIINADNKVTVACTNWDMACAQPKNFNIGCQPIAYQNENFEAHRWDENYRALTEKKEESDDELFAGAFYYFEIDWRPTEIIWRIGSSPDKMRVVGYMNDEITAIPNNQMLLIITQEYHNTKWWPGAPYSQDNLPFPLNDIPGEIYEMVIE